MHQYLARRLLAAIPVLLLASVWIFGLMRFLPGDAVWTKLASDAESRFDPEVAAELRRQLGLDQPYHVQYWEWISGIVLRGDMGRSFFSKETVADEILKRVPVTLELALGTTLVALAIAIPVGIVAAIRQDTGMDYVGRVGAIIGLAVPNFWLGTLLLLLPAIWFGYTPPFGYVNAWENPGETLRLFAFPCLALGASFAASIMRMTRSQLLEVLRQDYIRTAWAKGLRERVVVFRHALKNALIPVVSVVGVQIGHLLGGSVVIETVFGLPGLGALTVFAIRQRDYPVIQGVVLLLALTFVLVNLAVDFWYAWLDPRIRYGEAAT